MHDEELILLPGATLDGSPASKLLDLIALEHMTATPVVVYISNRKDDSN